jgi:murein DD-endopeptidase MepM/ murein hydrolase activator NlpD
MRKHKYFLDLNDLQYKRVRLPLEKKFLHAAFWIAGTLAITLLYAMIFENSFGSPKAAMLQQQIENLKLQYSLVNMDIDNSLEKIAGIEMSDEIRYRPILEMESVGESFRNPGFGGVERFRELDGYPNTQVMKSTRLRIEELKNKVTVQEESFAEIREAEAEWERSLDHIPYICPVDITIRRGDGLKFREIHPVWGTPQWHYGQDFSAPYGTEVYATGAGKVIFAGHNTGGFGNYVKIDHGYGYQTLYGHLSDISVSNGLNVKRGDIIGLSGNSGTSNGPHLHYQIELYGNHQNPLYFFNDDLTEDEYFEMIQLLSSNAKFR